MRALSTSRSSSCRGSTALRPHGCSGHTSPSPVTDLDEYGVALLVATAFDDLGIEYTLGGSLASRSC